MPQSIDRSLKYLAVAIIVLIAIAGVYAARGMHSDGSFWLVEMLPRGGFYIFDPHRAYVQVLVQAPVALAIWLGTLDLNLLIRLHSFGFVVVPIIFWLGALLLHVRSNLFWLFLSAYCVTYLRSNFFAAGEFSVAYGLAAFCTAILLRERLSYQLVLMLIVASAILTHSYEATLFLGLFLATIVIVRWRKIPTDQLVIKLSLVIPFVLFIAAAYVGARSTFFERNYNGGGAANFSAFKEIYLQYLIFMPLLVVLLCTTFAQKFKKIVVASLIAFSGLYLLYTFRWDQTNISFGYFSYAYRALCSFLLLGVLTLAAALFFWPNTFKRRSQATGNAWLAIGAMAFFVSMAWPMLYHTYGFYKWAQRFETQALSIQAHTHIDKTPINRSHGLTDGYNWMWGNPSTSILLRGNAEAMILNNTAHKGFEPINPEATSGQPNEPKDRASYEKYSLRPFEKKSLLYPW
jgi:hypothetical protein